MKKMVSMILALSFCLFCVQTVWASGIEGDNSADVDSAPFEVNAKSAILMEAKTGKILFSQNPDEPLAPASVTKVMTLLLVMEAVKENVISLDDKVTISEYAASMGGSQVFLEAGEQFSVKELIKCTVISSANDAAVALAEFVHGSEEAFVKKMNERGKELGLTGSNFENVTGLDDTTVNHTFSAGDIAKVSRELITFPLILEYSSTWMDSIRDGAFTLTNTNRLVRFYPGATGLKTGSTSKAKFCLSATAERDGMTLIAVVLGADTRDIRNSETMRLLDFGFANYALYHVPASDMSPIYVTGGENDTLNIRKEEFSLVIEKGKKGRIKETTELPTTISAPVKIGQQIGTLIYSIDGETVGTSKIYASEGIEKITFGAMFLKILQTFLHPS